MATIAKPDLKYLDMDAVNVFEPIENGHLSMNKLKIEIKTVKFTFLRTGNVISTYRKVLLPRVGNCTIFS